MLFVYRHIPHRFGPQLVETLQEHGVNAADIKKLKSNGYATVESVAYATKKALIKVKGISARHDSAGLVD